MVTRSSLGLARGSGPPQAPGPPGPPRTLGGSAPSYLQAGTVGRRLPARGASVGAARARIAAALGPPRTCWVNIGRGIMPGVDPACGTWRRGPSAPRNGRRSCTKGQRGSPAPGPTGPRARQARANAGDGRPAPPRRAPRPGRGSRCSARMPASRGPPRAPRISRLCRRRSQGSPRKPWSPTPLPPPRWPVPLAKTPGRAFGPVNAGSRRRPPPPGRTPTPPGPACRPTGRRPQGPARARSGKEAPRPAPRRRAARPRGTLPRRWPMLGRPLRELPMYPAENFLLLRRAAALQPPPGKQSRPRGPAVPSFARTKKKRPRRKGRGQFQFPKSRGGCPTSEN